MRNPTMASIAVLAATGREISPLAASFPARPEPSPLPWDISTALLGSKRVIFAVTGVGIANAAAATAAVNHRYAPDLCIVTGCAGAYPGSELAIGDLALATTEVFADTGVAAPEGWRDLRSMGLPLQDRNGVVLYNDIPLCPRAAEMALCVARHTGVSLRRGVFLTVSTCSGTSCRGEELSARFGAICENMEGAAVALTAARFGVDCLEIRGISNHVEDRDISRWDISSAVAASSDFVERLLQEL